MRKSIITLLAAAVALASCAKHEAIQPADKSEVHFTTNIQTYAVKATDTAFENGDKIGIFAGAPINKNNVEGTISGTSVTMSDPIHWVEGDNGVVEFIGYYPYAAGMSKQGSFAVKADQRKAADYTASDLMIAKVSKAPSDDAVVLPFKHALSKVVLNITNEVAGTVINEVRFTDVALSANVDLATATISDVAAEKGAIKANAAGESYQLVVIPQSASPKVLVEVSDGNTYTFSLAQAFSFKSGKKVTANITVSESAPIVFSFEVSDWDVEEEALEFENTAVDPTGGWAVYGSWDEWAEGIAMTRTSEDEAEVEVWEADITYAEGDEFKLRNGDIWAGMKAGWEYYGTGEFEDGYLDATENGINIVLEGAGEYHLVFSWPTCKFVVTKAGDEPQPGDGWAVYGSWDEWAEGIEMTLTSEEGAEVEVWEADITYAEGDEFKLRSGDIWAGMKAGWEYYGTGDFEDGYLDATQDGINIILEGAGEYHLVFSWPTCKFVVTKDGDEPDPQPGEGWAVYGSWDEWAEGIAMTLTSEEGAEEEIWEADITYAEGDEFKLRSGSTWAGMKEGWEYYGTGDFPEGYLAADPDKNINIILQGAGEYHLVFSWPSCKFVVTKEGDEPQPQPGEGWEVMGSWNEWAEGIAMTLTSEEGAEEEVWEADITYAEGDEFKLRNGSTWAGMKEGWEYYGTGDFPEGYLAADPDKNINIVLEGAGDYHLVFSWPSCKFVVTKEGDEPQPIPDTATLTLNVFNQANWDLKLWAWQGASNLCGTWPGIGPNAADVTVAGNTYKSFTLDVASGVEINYLLNNNGNAQTSDMVLAGIEVEGTVYVWLKSDGSAVVIDDPATFEPGEPDPTVTLTLNVYNSAGWDDLHVYCWKDSDPWPNYTGIWRGQAAEATDVVVGNNSFKSFVIKGIPTGANDIKYIINGPGEGVQTANLSLDAITANTTLYVELKADKSVATITDPANFVPSN